jgi:hypothetical protein
MAQYSIETAVRMVGNLLKYHPTTGTYARDSSGTAVSYYAPDAECFCYMGASYRVAGALDFSWYLIDSTCDRVLETRMEGEVWDHATDFQRAAWADKLASYKGSK